jgi:hypothetical protein
MHAQGAQAAVRTLDKHWRALRGFGGMRLCIARSYSLRHVAQKNTHERRHGACGLRERAGTKAGRGTPEVGHGCGAHGGWWRRRLTECN